jgi:hypothetical protein
VRERPDVVLGQPGFIERTDDAELARGPAAGPVVAAVVEVAAVGDGVEATGTRQRGELGVELVLAVVAAVAVVLAVLGALELGGADDFVMQLELRGDVARHLTVTLGIAGAVGGDAQRAIAERLSRGPGEERRIDAAAVGDDQ